MLFDNVDSSKVAQLDSVEMSETKGEFLGGLLVSLGVSVGTWALSCALNGACNNITFGSIF